MKFKPTQKAESLSKCQKLLPWEYKYQKTLPFVPVSRSTCVRDSKTKDVPCSESLIAVRTEPCGTQSNRQSMFPDKLLQRAAEVADKYDLEELFPVISQ